MSKQYLFIGASAASFGALQSVRRSDPHAHITIISAESELPYNKCLLADYLGGTLDQAALSLYPNSYASIALILGQKVINIDSDAKKVTTDGGQTVSYDALFLGMGSNPFVPQIPGIKSQGIFTFHTHGDANAILAYVNKHSVKKVSIIGAGLSGLEAADALLKNNLDVTIIERNSQVLPWLLSSSAAEFLHTKIDQLKTRLILNATVSEIVSSQEKVSGVIANGQHIETDLVIIATGLQPNVQLCQQAGITLDTHGVVVNQYLQTNMPDIYAGGDIIGVTDLLTGRKLRSCLWPDAMQQGMHAGMAMAGKPKAYSGITMITSTAFFGMKYARAGSIEASPAELIIKKGTDFHHTFVIQDGKLKAFQVVGAQHTLGDLRRLLLTQTLVTPDQL